MKPILPLFIMVDACGWEIAQRNRFLAALAPVRRKLQSVFGYSSTCIPSIVSGRWPESHRNWCYFVYDPARSPFRSLRWLRWLPKFVTGRRIFRRWLTRFVRAKLSFRGYFDLYNIPFRYIHLFDFTEKKSPLLPGGMNHGTNIFDRLEELRTPYFTSDPAQTEEANKLALLRAIRAENIDFAFMYWPGLDGLMHMEGNDAPSVGERLRMYEGWIEELSQAASAHYEEVRLYVFSDHGMANCDKHVDLKSRIEALPLAMGRDYAVVYDSTMARFWFLREGARERIVKELEGVQHGRIVPEQELKDLRVHFADGYFGELIFLMDEGVLIVPSHMGERPIRAMHGYHPAAPQSWAALMTSNTELPVEITALPDLYRLMERDAEAANEARLRQAGCLADGQLAGQQP